MAVPYTPPDNLQVSFYLLKNCDLWVWDFDDTLIDTTTYYVQDMSTKAILDRTEAELNQEWPCWKYFRDLVIFLVSNGKRVGIASFGTYEIIQAYMDRVFGRGQKYFTRVNIMAACMEDRRNREFKMPHNKNPYIYDLMKFYRVQDYPKVVLFDDLASNIADASAIGVLAIIVPGRDLNGINNTRRLFCPELMSSIDFKVDKKCGKNIYLNRDFGSLGFSKSTKRDSNFSKVVRYRHPNRIYKSRETIEREKKEEERQQRIDEEREEEEGFQNQGDDMEENDEPQETFWGSLQKIFGDSDKTDCGCTGNAWLIYMVILFVLLVVALNI